MFRCQVAEKDKASSGKVGPGRLKESRKSSVPVNGRRVFQLEIVVRRVKCH